MFFARLLQTDLAGRIAFWKRKYKTDYRQFDYRRIYCSVIEWNGPCFSVSAAAYCADPLVSEGSSTTLRVYRTRAKFKSQVEAEAHLQEQVRTAAAAHPQSKFYRQLFVNATQSGDTGRRRGPLLEAYENGEWRPAPTEGPTAVCPGCGANTNGPICANCGEPVYT